MTYTHTDGMDYSAESEYGRLIILFLKNGVNTYRVRLSASRDLYRDVDWDYGVTVDDKRFHSMSGVVRYVWVKYGRNK